MESNLRSADFGCETTDAEKDAIRHQDFWFQDGSIILSVETTLFRVHRTMLSTYSEVFAAMFTLPQPPDQDTLEGCLVVRLYDDITDFVDLMNAIYTPGHFDNLSVDANLDTVISFISGILRLSTKYAISFLRQTCIRFLKVKFPTTFAEYTALASSHKLRHQQSDALMRAINLAQETHVLEILPYAYYCVARMRMERILSHSSTDISWRDKTICLAGRERLRFAMMSLSHAFLLAFQPSPACQSFAFCSAARGPHKEWHVLESSKSPNPLKQYTKWDLLNVCRECVAAAQSQHRAGREEVWKLLPDFFELPRWEDLREVES